MKTTRRLLALLLLSSLVWGCSSVPTSEDDDQAPTEVPGADAPEASEQFICALNRAQIEHRRQQSAALPGLFEATLGALRRPDDPAERVEMLRRDWNADWDVDEIQEFTLETTAYGPRITGSGTNVSAVAEFSHRLNTLEQFPDVVLDKMNVLDETITFVFAPTTRVEPADHDSCEFPERDSSISFDDEWTTKSDGLMKWESQRWSAKFEFESTEVVSQLQSLRPQLQSIDSATLSWNGEALAIDLSIIDRSQFGEAIAEFPINSSSDGIDLSAYDKSSTLFRPEQDWLDDFEDDPRVEANEATLKRLGNVYAEVLERRARLSAIEHLQRDHQAREETFQCLFWALTGESEDLGEFDTIEARDRWRTRVESGDPYINLDRLELNDGEEISLAVSSTDAALVNAFQTEMTDCTDRPELQWKHLESDDRSITTIRFDLEHRREDQADLAEIRTFSSAEDMVARVAQDRTSYTAYAQELEIYLEDLVRDLQLKREILPLRLRMEDLYVRLSNIFYTTDFIFKDTKIENFNCARFDYDQTLTAINIDINGKADSASLLLALSLSARITQMVTPVALDVVDSDDRSLNFHGVFSTFTFDPDNPFCQ